MLQEYPNIAADYFAGDVVQQQHHLHYQQGSSDKVYIVCIVQTRSGDFDVYGLYGRRGARLQVSNQGTYGDLKSAGFKMANVVSQKQRKGYNMVGNSVTAQTNVAGPNKKMTPSVQAIVRNARIGPLLGERSVGVIQNALMNDDIIIEPFYDNVDNCHMTDLFYVTMNCDPSIEPGWQIFNTHNGQHVRSEDDMPDDWQVESENRGTVFLAYQTHQKRMALIDLVYVGPTNRYTTEQPWKVRRAMMTEMYRQLFPKRDPYDPGFFCHINEYYHDDKLDIVNKQAGSHFVIRSTEHKMAQTAFVFQA
jgi:hypothetical protein